MHTPLPDTYLAQIRAAVLRAGRDCPTDENLYRALGEAEAHREALLAEVDRLKEMLLIVG